MEPNVKHFFRLAFLNLFLGICVDLFTQVKIFHKCTENPEILVDLANTSNFIYVQGFLVLGLAGFIYHMLPKLMGSFLYSKNLMGTHLLFAFIGIPVAIIFSLSNLWIALGINFTFGQYIIIPLGIVYLGNLLFLFNILKSFNNKGK